MSIARLAWTTLSCQPFLKVNQTSGANVVIKGAYLKDRLALHQHPALVTGVMFAHHSLRQEGEGRASPALAPGRLTRSSLLAAAPVTGVHSVSSGCQLMVLPTWYWVGRCPFGLPRLPFGFLIAACHAASPRFMSSLALARSVGCLLGCPQASLQSSGRSAPPHGYHQTHTVPRCHPAPF